MRLLHVCAVLMALCLNNCAFAQAPKPTPKPARPSMVLADNSLLLVMNSANVTVRMNEAKDKLFTASFTNATMQVEDHTTTSTATLVFDKAVLSAKELVINSFGLVFNFMKEGSYWVLKNATATLLGTENGKSFNFKDSVLISDVLMYAPLNESFHCSRMGALYPAEGGGNHSFAVDLNGFQVEPFSLNTKKFSQAYECVGFFSIGILSGIFVTLILMAVIVWGLAMIMDVKTMDRFDDPKGKPMTFGGTE